MVGLVWLFLVREWSSWWRGVEWSGGEWRGEGEGLGGEYAVVVGVSSPTTSITPIHLPHPYTYLTHTPPTPTTPTTPIHLPHPYTYYTVHTFYACYTFHTFYACYTFHTYYACYTYYVYFAF